MAEKSPVVVRRTRSEAAQRDFRFTPQMLRLDVASEVVRAYRQKAWDTYRSMALPNTREEAWRRTDLRELNPERFHLPALEYQKLTSLPAGLPKSRGVTAKGSQLVLTDDGVYQNLDAELAAKGVIFTDLRSAETHYPQLLEKVIGKLVQPESSKFAALAGALAQNGFLLYVPQNVQLAQPLHSLLVGTGKEQAYLTHVFVYLEKGASASYLHEVTSVKGSTGAAFHAGIVEVFVGEGASLRLVELQAWDEQVWNFSHARCQVAQDANLEWVLGAVGSRLTKSFIDLDLVGKGSTGKMSGFYLADGHQHLDFDTQQNHLAAHTTSDLLFKGALMGESRSVWQGMIHVAQDCPKADGYQSNRNLILNAQARADSIPGLEILTDDVRCTHGATVGKIDPEQIFFLCSRGIPRPEAVRLIVEGFFDPVMQRIPFEVVRKRFQQKIHQKIAALEK